MKDKTKAPSAQPALEENNRKAIPWQPTYKWFAKTSAIIFVALLIIFFALNILFKPYMRKISSEITPWLCKTGSVNK
ncbi:MAG: hypothetical protein FWD54_06825 [Endomicrobia bacterium]|nr:hypothetical protein [Endomicrobiia bacterium]MCL2799970.1 hypothetical protein [Endomicrobiia bacterium]